MTYLLALLLCLAPVPSHLDPRLSVPSPRPDIYPVGTYWGTFDYSGLPSGFMVVYDIVYRPNSWTDPQPVKIYKVWTCPMNWQHYTEMMPEYKVTEYIKIDDYWTMMYQLGK